MTEKRAKAELEACTSFSRGEARKLARDEPPMLISASARIAFIGALKITRGSMHTMLLAETVNEKIKKAANGEGYMRKYMA